MMDHVSADGKRRYVQLNDGTPMTPTVCKGSGTFRKSYAPGKVAVDPTELKKSKPGHAVPEINRRMLAGEPRNTAAPDATVHQVGAEAMPVLKYGAIYHWIGPDQMLRHGVIVGMSATHVLLATRDGKFTAPRAKLSPGIHPDAETKEDKQ